MGGAIDKQRHTEEFKAETIQQITEVVIRRPAGRI